MAGSERVETNREPSDESLYEAVFSYVRRRERNREAVEDMVQEVFCRLAAQRPPIPNDRKRAWLYRTARHLLVDRIRRRKTEQTALDRIQAASPLADRNTPDRLLIQNEENRQVLNLICQLDPVHQEVVRLKFQEGLSYQEIAEVMSKTKTTVAWLLHESLVRLRQEVGSDTGSLCPSNRGKRDGGNEK